MTAKKSRIIAGFRVSEEDQVSIINSSRRFSSMSEYFVTLHRMYNDGSLRCPLVTEKPHSKEKGISWRDVVR